VEATIENQDALVKVREAVEATVEAFEPNATYRQKPAVKEYMALPMVKALIHALATGQRYYFVGPAGIGKTSMIKQLGTQLGYDVIVVNAANLSVENLKVPFPEDNEQLGLKVLKSLFYHRFTTDNRKLIFIDEIGRADDGMANTLMELLQEGTLGGWKIPNLAAVVAADNPQGSSYGRLAGLDFSQADRFAAVQLDYKSTPWRRALAQRFPETDLTKVFSTFDTLPDEVRAVLNPRVIEFMVPALQAGFPAEYALPIVNGLRKRLVNASGDDVTDTVLDRIAAAIGVPNPEHVTDLLDRAVRYALDTGSNIYVQGRPGIGKTSRIKGILEEQGIRYAYDSAAVLQPEDLNVPFPSSDGRSLDLVVDEKFAIDTPWVWIVDEIGRGTRRAQNAMMEPIQERTLGGQDTNIVCTIALNNPREVAGFKLDVGKNDLAQASRFALSIEIEADSIPSARYLREQYGEEVATPFVEWWEDDLDDVGRVLCTPRALERMISLYEAGNPLQWGLPYIKGDYVKVPLVDLQARLEKRPLARLKAIVADADRYAEELAKGKDDAAMEHATVFMAFYKADLAQLEEVKDVCSKLFHLLDRQHRIDLVRQGGERQRFWNEVLLS